MPIAIDTEACTGCEICDDVCPIDVIRMTDIGGKRVAYMKYPEECFHCQACIIDCPEDCIGFDFKTMYVDWAAVDMGRTAAPVSKDAGVRKWHGVDVDVAGTDPRWSAST